MIDRFWRDMELPAARRPIASRAQVGRQTRHVNESAELVIVMLVTELAVQVVVKARKNDRPTCTATGGGTKGTFKENSLASEIVQMGRLYNWIPVTTCVSTVVVGHKQDDIPLGSNAEGAEQACGNETKQEIANGETHRELIQEKRTVRHRKPQATKSPEMRIPSLSWYRTVLWKQIA